MKIYILPIDEKLRPGRQPNAYPKHNADYGVEQDFHAYLLARPELLTADPAAADWHYLPAYWTRWHLAHNYAKNGAGLAELQAAASAVMIDPAKAFTICQYDDGPLIDLGGALKFLASRKTAEGVDIPLLSSPHRMPWFMPTKHLRASFVGRLENHPLRLEMKKALSGLEAEGIVIINEDRGEGYFTRAILSSYISLCPRGYGGSSFRFFESMALGVVPLLLGDLDTRPFKEDIDWSAISLYARTAAELKTLVLSLPFERLEAMGKEAKRIYESELSYGNWCRHVLDQLGRLERKKK